jgi:glycosyltransferase involved in cell wall biosynthesis
MPTIAVALTYFNEGPLLSECLNTLATQTSPPDEILIYDDASNTPPAPYIPEGLPVRIIRGRENRGPAFGRNVLLAESTSQYIHFHDSDDWFHADWCGRVRAVLDEHHPDVIFTEISSYRKGILHVKEVLDLRSLPEDADLLAFAIGGVLLTPSGTYSKDLVLRAGGYRTALWQSEDFDFHLRLLALTPKSLLVREPLIGIRLHSASRSNDEAACLKDLVKSLQLVAPDLPAKYHPHICERLGGAACVLFRLGDVPGGEYALQLAKKFGRPTFSKERLGFRGLARVLGPARAVRATVAYRSVLPRRFRHWIAVQRF